MTEDSIQTVPEDAKRDVNNALQCPQPDRAQATEMILYHRTNAAAAILRGIPLEVLA